MPHSAREWVKLSQKERVNPCGSPFHPAAPYLHESMFQDAAAAAQRVTSVQEAYDPDGVCFCCGPSQADGLRMRSFRTPDGLETSVTVPAGRFLELPGTVSPGVLTALLSCHSNWASSLALMDKGVLPRPPLMVAQRLSVEFSSDSFIAEETALNIKSRLISLKDTAEPYTVEVDAVLSQAESGEEVARCRATFVKIGAARSLGG